MARRGNDAALKDVLMLLLVCERHCSESITINNPLQEAITMVPPIPSCQSMNFEDEEELNSWIWRSSHIQRNGARKIMRNKCQWRH